MDQSMIQALVNSVQMDQQEKRKETQLTLGELIAQIERLPAAVKIVGPGEPDSYRGYYCDLAFEPSEESLLRTVALQRCRECLGKRFEGYKGGDFYMNEDTPVWIAEYGRMGKRIVAVRDDGTLELAEEVD